MAFEDIYQGYVLVDSSALIALIDEQDQYHDVSVIALEELVNEPDVRLFICNLTVYETYTRLRYLFSWERAVQVWQFISTRIQPRHIEFRSHLEATTREILERYRSHKLSFHDAGCAAIMLDQKIGRVFTFDSDFSIIGFERYPD